MRVGFIGLGEQGAPIAQRIIAAGYPVTLWARRAATLAPFAQSGAATAPDLATLAAMSDVIGICVRNDDDTRDLLDGSDGLISRMSPGTVVVIHSTISPLTCQALAHDARQRGIEVVDAPVSGGSAAARTGQLAVMVGASEATFERCRPLFATFGDPVVRMGEVGTGQLAKVVNNALYTAHIALVDDAMKSSQSLGLDIAALLHVLRNGSGRSATMERYDPLLGAQSYLSSLGLLDKDVAIYCAALRSADVPAGILARLARASVELLAHGAKRLESLDTILVFDSSRSAYSGTDT